MDRELDQIKRIRRDVMSMPSTDVRNELAGLCRVVSALAVQQQQRIESLERELRTYMSMLQGAAACGTPRLEEEA